MISIVIYGVVWMSFAGMHSILTLTCVKKRLEPRLGASYRLIYNLTAGVHIALVLLIGRWLLDIGVYGVLSSGLVWFLLNMLVGGGVLLILLSLRQYDLGTFSGFSQLRKSKLSNDKATLEPLNTQGLNGWVRHPLYSGAFLYLWGNASSSYGLWTAVFASIYLVIGSRHEERKLVSLYGLAYTQYQAKVPAFVPWKWK